LYVPAGHAWHAPGVPVKPGPHWHAALPATETVLLGHAAHVLSAKYVFAGQAEQVRLAILEQFDAPANEYKPLAHVKQLLILVAPTTLDAVPAGHRVHALTPNAFEYVPARQAVQTLAPTAPENVPTGQLVHAALLVTPLYCPAEQAVQGPPYGPV